MFIACLHDLVDCSDADAESEDEDDVFDEFDDVSTNISEVIHWMQSTGKHPKNLHNLEHLLAKQKSSAHDMVAACVIRSAESLTKKGAGSLLTRNTLMVDLAACCLLADTNGQGEEGDLRSACAVSLQKPYELFHEACTQAQENKARIKMQEVFGKLDTAGALLIEVARSMLKDHADMDTVFTSRARRILTMCNDASKKFCNMIGQGVPEEIVGKVEL